MIERTTTKMQTHTTSLPTQTSRTTLHYMLTATLGVASVFVASFGTHSTTNMKNNKNCSLTTKQKHENLRGKSLL